MSLSQWEDGGIRYLMTCEWSNKNAGLSQSSLLVSMLVRLHGPLVFGQGMGQARPLRKVMLLFPLAVALAGQQCHPPAAVAAAAAAAADSGGILHHPAPYIHTINVHLHTWSAGASCNRVKRTNQRVAGVGKKP